MKYSKILLLALALIVTSVAQAQSISPEKQAEITKLLELTGLQKLIGQMTGQMIATMKAQMPQVPADFWTTQATAEVNPQDLINKMMPVYDKYYDLDELKAVNAFYSSPVGQKMLASQPLVMREAQQVGQQWGQAAAAKLQQDAATAAAAGAAAPKAN